VLWRCRAGCRVSKCRAGDGGYGGTEELRCCPGTKVPRRCRGADVEVEVLR
jgi:hypothetical protein